MKSQRKGLSLILLIAALCVSGCSLDKGLRDGLTDGVSSALSLIIQAPINYALDQVFAEP